jgi:methylmalonyl-CoA/ethylmalonyl-CoA epimerase
MLVAKQYSQIAWVVDDLDAAVRQWQQTARIGPFYVGAHVGALFTEATFRGSPFEVDISCAVAQAGPVQIELIKQHGAAPSPYRDVFADGEGGLHHLCSFVDDVDAECRNYQEHGFDVVMTGSVARETPVAYLDTRATLGCMTELMNRSDFVEGLYAKVAAAAADWDGSDQVRDFMTLLA